MGSWSRRWAPPSRMVPRPSRWDGDIDEQLFPNDAASIADWLGIPVADVDYGWVYGRSLTDVVNGDTLSDVGGVAAVSGVASPFPGITGYSASEGDDTRLQAADGTPADYSLQSFAFLHIGILDAAPSATYSMIGKGGGAIRWRLQVTSSRRLQTEILSGSGAYPTPAGALAVGEPFATLVWLDRTNDIAGTAIDGSSSTVGASTVGDLSNSPEQLRVLRAASASAPHTALATYFWSGSSAEISDAQALLDRVWVGP